MLKCPICSHEFTDKGEIEDHLKNTHFLDMAVYYEMDLRENEYCYRCGNSRHPLTYLVLIEIRSGSLILFLATLRYLVEITLAVLR